MSDHDAREEYTPDPPASFFDRYKEESIDTNKLDITHVVIDSETAQIEHGAYSDCENVQMVDFHGAIALTAIGVRSFQNCWRLVELELPDGLDTIGGCAFLNCHALRTIRSPSTLARVGESAFEACTSLRSISKLDGLLFLGHKAFAYCEELVDIQLPDHLRYIGHSAFMNCQSLRQITVPSELDFIWNRLFQMCTSLHEVTLQEGLRTIFRYAFTMCTSLRSIDIPSTVQTVEEEAFFSCTSITTVTLREGLVNIAHQAFSHCESLESISIPSTVNSLGNAAFQGCRSLIDVELKEGLAGIGISTFADCRSICGVSFPQSLKVLRGTAFSNCSKLLGVEIPMDSDLMIYRDESAFRKRPCFSGCDELVSVSIPSTMMADLSSEATTGFAFSKCIKLQNVDTEEFQLHKVRDRFRNLPVHACCYYASSTSLDDLVKAIDDSYHAAADSSSSEPILLDAFGMTPFHTVATSPMLRADVLQVLLGRYPTPVIFQKDDFGKTMMDYLMMQESSKAIQLVKMTLQSAIDHAMNGCSLSSWRDDLLASVQRESFTLQGGNYQESRQNTKWACYKRIMKRFSHYIKMESTTILELVLWKMRIHAFHLEDSETTDRDNCRWQCRSDVVIQNVLVYAWDDQNAASVTSFMLPLCTSIGVNA